MLKVLLSVLLLGASAWSCSTKSMAAATDQPGAGALLLNLNSEIILDAVNNARKKGCNCGGKYMPPVPAVTWNDQLAQAAFNHSKDMNENGFFSHDSPKGSPGERIRKAGYNWKAYGENLAYDDTDEKGVVQGWLKSPSHCKTIMSPLYKEIGAGRAGAYWTMDFGAR